MLHKAWNSKGEMPYCFPRSSIKFQGHTVQNITDFDPNWAFPDYRPVAAFKSLRFALFLKELLFDIILWDFDAWTKWSKLWANIVKCIFQKEFLFLAATKQLYEWFSPSVCLSVRLFVCLSHLFDYVPIIVSSQIFQKLLPMTEIMSIQKVKVKGQGHRGHNPA